MTEESEALKELCKYGSECYQKNPVHLKRFRHPPKKRKNSDEEEILEPKAIKTLKLRPNRQYPEDFRSFYDFCAQVKPDDPQNALFPTTGLRLIEDFYKFDDETRWRFYYDPPEFQTLIVQTAEDGSPCVDGVHFGYFWDDPKEPPVFVGRLKNNSSKINLYGDNLFSAVFNWVKSIASSADPFKKTTLHKLSESIQKFAFSKNYSLDLNTKKMLERNKKKVATLFHGAGLVVPYNKKTQAGYRELGITGSRLKKILKKIVEASAEDVDDKMDALQEIITNVQFANDEGDPGMGYELGINIFSYEDGSEVFNPIITHLLTVAYDLVDRKPFAETLKAHLIFRKKEEIVGNWQ